MISLSNWRYYLGGRLRKGVQLKEEIKNSRTLQNSKQKLFFKKGFLFTGSFPYLLHCCELACSVYSFNSIYSREETISLGENNCNIFL